MVELARVAELRPAGGAPDFLPPRVSIRACSVPAVNETCGRRVNYLLVRVVDRGPLDRRVEVRDRVTGVEPNEVREMTVRVIRGVHVDLPLCER